MNITKGEWIATTSDGQVGMVWNKSIYLVADCRKSGLNDKENNANAHLITATVNACKKINPDNPMAAAESIGDMYEALRAVCDFTIPTTKCVDKARQALAKADGK